MSAAVIETVRVSAAHDGEAELVVRLRFANGGCSDVPLDHHAACHLLEAVGAASAEALVGIGWEPVRNALAAASARFLEPPASPPSSPQPSSPFGDPAHA